MAKPIRDFKRTQPKPEQTEQQNVLQLLKTVSDNHDAIVDTLEVLGYLHDSGVLAIAKGLLANRSEVAGIAVRQLNQPKMHHMMKNMMTIFEAFGSMEPEPLQKMLQGMANGLESTKDKQGDGKTPSLWSLAKSLGDPHVRTSMATMVGLLQGMGESLYDTSRNVQ